MRLLGRARARGMHPLPKRLYQACHELFIGHLESILAQRETIEHAEKARAKQGGSKVDRRQIRIERSARLLCLDEVAHHHVKALGTGISLPNSFPVTSREFRVRENRNRCRNNLLEETNEVQTQPAQPFARTSSGDLHQRVFERGKVGLHGCQEKVLFAIEIAEDGSLGTASGFRNLLGGDTCNAPIPYQFPGRGDDLIFGARFGMVHDVYYSECPLIGQTDGRPGAPTRQCRLSST